VLSLDAADTEINVASVSPCMCRDTCSIVKWIPELGPWLSAEDGPEPMSLLPYAAAHAG
jgi:hypothetical protein